MSPFWKKSRNSIRKSSLNTSIPAGHSLLLVDGNGHQGGWKFRDWTPGCQVVNLHTHKTSAIPCFYSLMIFYWIVFVNKCYKHYWCYNQPYYSLCCFWWSSSLTATNVITILLALLLCLYNIYCYVITSAVTTLHLLVLHCNCCY